MSEQEKTREEYLLEKLRYEEWMTNHIRLTKKCPCQLCVDEIKRVEEKYERLFGKN